MRKVADLILLVDAVDCSEQRLFDRRIAKNIRTFIADQEIAANASGYDIVAHAADELVVAPAAIELVVARIALEEVVARRETALLQNVIAFTA